MRQTTFPGLRPDNSPKEVLLELAPETIQSFTGESGRSVTVEITFAVSLDFELFRSIDPNFRLSFVGLKPAGDLDALTFDFCQHWRLIHGRCRRIQPVNVWFG